MPHQGTLSEKRMIVKVEHGYLGFLGWWNLKSWAAFGRHFHFPANRFFPSSTTTSSSSIVVQPRRRKPEVRHRKPHPQRFGKTIMIGGEAATTTTTREARKCRGSTPTTRYYSTSCQKSLLTTTVMNDIPANEGEVTPHLVVPEKCGWCVK